MSGAGILLVVIVGACLSVGVSVPSIASAEMYAYVDTSSEVKTVNAVDWRTAIATAQNIHRDSGVVLLTPTSNYDIIGETIPGVARYTSGSGTLYAYVDTNGEVKSVAAVDWRTAIATAQNIHRDSGVVLLTPTSNYDIIGETIPGAQ